MCAHSTALGRRFTECVEPQYPHVSRKNKSCAGFGTNSEYMIGANRIGTLFIEQGCMA